MSHEAHTFILRATNDEQAEYAARPHRSPCKSVQCVTCCPSMDDAYNAAIELPAAPSPAAGRYPETAVRKGSQAAASVTDSPAADVEGASASGAQIGRGAESARALGHEAGNETSGQPSAMRADTSPAWGPVCKSVGALLDFLAANAEGEDFDWRYFISVLWVSADETTGQIDQNDVRPLLRGQIKPQRIGAFYHRATKGGLISWDGTWRESDDLTGKNSGKPTRVYVWLGAAS